MADSIRLMSLIGRPDERDYLSRPYGEMEWSTEPLTPKGMRIALQLDAGSGLPVEPETLATVQRAASLFAEAGAIIEPFDPFVGADVLDGLVDFWRSRSYADYEELSEAERASVLPFIAEWCLAGAEFSAAQTIRNRNRIDEMAQLTRAATAGYDLILSPVTPVAAFAAEDPMPITDPSKLWVTSRLRCRTTCRGNRLCRWALACRPTVAPSACRSPLTLAQTRCCCVWQPGSRQCAASN
ncbi:hypothetical protein [Leucobacter coleopterorum]|uniref:hypothetical protein n=1 Tax=Leucobacter coleopterorum TaxID=2714933 RepID=UPI003137D54D